MIIRHWSPEFQAQFGGRLPDDYCTFDTETTGFNRKKDLIVEWGHCLVRDRQPVDRLNLIINWMEAPELIPGIDVAELLERVRHRMAINEKEFHITPQIMQEQGVSPHEALPFIRDFLVKIRSNGELLASQNGWGFDVKMLATHFEDFLEDEFVLDDNEMLDVGAIIKASQMLDNENVFPRPGETLGGYCRRVMAMRAKGVKWNIEYAFEEYGLGQRLGLSADELHGAGADAYALHGLIERIRELAAEEDSAGVPVIVSPPKVQARPVQPKPSPQPTVSGRRHRGQRNR